MSRRAAELAILEGRVRINDRPARLGDRGESSDRITLDGVELPRKEEKRYYMLNKPRGYVCSLHDEQGRKSVRELLPASAGRVYPVGRLDLMSEGLLLLTNDGEFANRVMHPSSRILRFPSFPVAKAWAAPFSPVHFPLWPLVLYLALSTLFWHSADRLQPTPSCLSSFPAGPTGWRAVTERADSL